MSAHFPTSNSCPNCVSNHSIPVYGPPSEDFCEPSSSRQSPVEFSVFSAFPGRSVSVPFLSLFHLFPHHRLNSLTERCSYLAYFLTSNFLCIANHVHYHGFASDMRVLLPHSPNDSRPTIFIRRGLLPVSFSTAPRNPTCGKSAIPPRS